MTGRAERRGVLSWMLFDWASQPFGTLVITFVFAPYFAADVIGDATRGQALWGTAMAIAGGIAAAMAPVLGAVADRTGARKPWVLAFSVPFVIGCCGLWLAVPAIGDPLVVLVFFALAFIGSEFTLVFTNAMLPDLGGRSEIGRISGSGWAMGYLGGLVSLILMLGFVSPVPGSETTLIGLQPIFGLDPAEGEPARASGPLSALWFVLFALPLFLFTPDSPAREPLGRAVGGAWGDLVGTVALLQRERSLLAFLAASMIYRDALAALFAFGGIYAAGILGWTVFELGIFGIIAAGSGAIGAWLGGKADAAYGPRPVIVVSIWMLIVVCAIALLTTRDSILFVAVPEGSSLPDLVFYVAGIFLGWGAGTLQAASRTMLVHQAHGRVPSARAFGLYALSGKVTAFLGPALIAAATVATGSQQLGVSPVVALFLLGLALLYFVRSDDEQTQGHPA